MEDGYYNGNILSNAQILLAKIGLEQNLVIGKMNITEDLIDWALSTEDDNPLHIDTLLDKGYKYKCNGDSMFHVNKGIVGIRLDGVAHVYVDDVKVRYVKNIGLQGNETLAGAYEYSHDQQSRKGYRGANTFGSVVCYGHNVQFKNVFMNRIRSINGSAIGFCVMNQSNYVTFDKIKIINIKAGYKYINGKFYVQDSYGNDMEPTTGYPNVCQIAGGIIIEDDNCGVYKIGDYFSGKITAPCLAARFIHMADQTPKNDDEDGEDSDCPDF